MKTLAELNTFSALSVAYDDQGTGAETLADRYQINGLLDTAQPVMSNIEKICSAAGSWLSYDIHEGKWGVVINTTGTSVASFDDTNILGAITLGGTGFKELYNSVKVEFPHRDLKDSADFVTIEIADADRNDNEPDNTLNLNYDIINEPIQAQLLGLIELKQSRLNLTITFQSDYSKINVKAGDLIDVTNSRFGFVNKLFRVITTNEIQDNGALKIEFTCLEYDPNIYSTADLYRYTRTDENGIITLGSIGIPGTPQVTKFENDSRPRIVVETTAPTGIVEAIEYWLTEDTAVPNDANRSYKLIASIKPPGGGVYTSGQSVVLDYDTLPAGDFYVKVRGVNASTVGPFSSLSGLIEYVPKQITDAIGPNTGVVDVTGALITAFAANYLIGQVGDLMAGTINTGSLFYKIFEGFQEVTGIDILGQASSGTLVVSSNLAVQDEGVNLTTQTSTINFVGSLVTASNAGGVVTVVIGDEGGGGGGVSGITITGVSPDYGPTAGGTEVTITGSGFTGANSVSFGGTAAAEFTVTNSTTISATTPAHSSGTVVVTVGNSSGTNSLNNAFTFIQADGGYLDILDKLPPDRTTQYDPVTGASTDQAPKTGSYFISFSKDTPYYGALTLGSGNVYLYKSDGTLVETLAAGDCSIFGDTALELPFADRELGTDYYILMDYDVVRYCDYISPAIDSPTGWNFNTPLYEVTPYTSITRETITSTSSSTFTATGLTVSPTLATSATFTSTFSINWSLSARAGSGNVYVKDWETDVTVLTYTASQLFSNATSLGSLEPSSKYYVTADAGVAVNDGYSDCYVASLNSSAAVVKATGLTFTMMSEFELISYTVDDDPIGSNKINPQSNIILTFNRTPKFNTFGTISVYKSNGSLHQTFNVADTFSGQKVSEILWISGDSVYLNPTKDFEPGETYYVQASASSIKDNYGRSWAGINDTTTVRFTVDAGPTSTLTPVTTSSNSIELVFDREVVPGDGQLVIKDNLGNIVGYIDPTDSAITYGA